MGRLRRVWLASMVLAGLVAVAGCSTAEGVSGQLQSAATLPATLPPLLPPAGQADVRAADAALADTLDSELAGEEYERLRSLLILSSGRTVYERYFHSAPTAQHDVFAVTKSVTGILVGIAIGEGLIDDVDETLASLLPDRVARTPAEVAQVTLEQVLTDRAGLSNESPVDPTDPTGDWVAGLLANPVAAPGARFEYSDASVALLSAILARATGRSVLSYAREKLFAPLGIDLSPFAQVNAWRRTGSIAGAGFGAGVDLQGSDIGSSGLRLTGQDMAKLGLLMLQGGRWEGRQVVPAQWVRQATTTQADTGAFQVGYGYQWWTGRTSDGEPKFEALGAGRQTILVVPDRQLVVVYQIWLPESGDAPVGGLVRELVATTVLPALAH